jgi:Mlc titration factor MtfA (ptsG expression regulator)
MLRRRRLVKQPIPEHWLPILQEKVPFYRHLSGDLRQRFLGLLKVFLWEKTFIGAGGMEITDEVRLVISSCAVRLILYLDLSYYDGLTEIVVYPYAYTHKEEGDAILGEAWDWGTVVLSWPAVLEGLTHPEYGRDTAIHEFAHVLDRGNGVFDGTPKLKAREDYRPWAQVMSRHFLRLRDGVPGEHRVLRSYGGVNEAEFFAVATESYFESARQMKEYIPDLYAELQAFYGGDPAAEEQATQKCVKGDLPDQEMGT